jgi:hypothetical protein
MGCQPQTSSTPDEEYGFAAQKGGSQTENDEQRAFLSTLSQFGGVPDGAMSRSSLGGRHYLYSAEARFCLSGSADGCVHPCHSIRGWHLDLSLDQSLTLTALQQALKTHCPHIHHSDQGLQCAATDYTALLQQHGIQISMAEVGKPTPNGYAERLMRTIKEEEVDLSDYQDYYEAHRQIGQFLENIYMRKRVHSSLNYLTRAEFESHWLSAAKVDSNLPL